MKRLLPFILLLTACSKEEIVPVVEVFYTGTKNYVLSSYDLQTSNVNVDLLKLRRDKQNINNNWNILAVTFLDINGDGNDDIFYNSSFGTTDRTEGVIMIYKNGDYVVDNSYFTTPPALIHPRKAITGDFNNDKMPDIFIAATGDDRPPFAGEYTELLLSNKNKKYDLIKFTQREDFYHGTCSGDIDNDGDLDIFVLGRLDSYFLINDGKGNFTYSLTNIDKTNLIEQYQCELIDIDKDGYLDLIMGGHETMPGNTTRIYWGNPNFKYVNTNMTVIPGVVDWGVITDLDIYDLDNDKVNEIIVSRTGGRPYDFNIYFYSGWRIQILKLNNRTLTDRTADYIDNNIYTQSTPNNQEWIPWLRFGDYDNNGKVDLYSVRGSNLPLVRWELQSNKLIRIN